MRRFRSVPTLGSIFVGALLLALGACRDAPGPTGLDPSVPLEAKGGVDPMSRIHPLPPSLEQKVQALRNDLEASGHEVERGYWTLWGAEDCKFPLRTVGFCYGNNPTAPYLIAVVPQWKEEFTDRRLQQAILQARRNMSPTYRFDRREALVVLAEMPPPASYFGIATNIFTRQDVRNDNDPIFQKLGNQNLPALQDILFSPSPNPSRRMILASLGNTINNVVMEGVNGPPWGKQRYVVITPDQDMADEIIAALGRAGVGQAALGRGTEDSVKAVNSHPVRAPGATPLRGSPGVGAGGEARPVPTGGDPDARRVDTALARPTSAVRAQTPFGHQDRVRARSPL
jgi:hypothetical protein